MGKYKYKKNKRRKLGMKLEWKMRELLIFPEAF